MRMSAGRFLRRYLPGVCLILIYAGYLAGAQAADGAEAADSATALLGAMYWTHAGEGIYRGARDGTEIKLLVARPSINGIAVDSEGGKLYWCVSNPRPQRSDQVWGAGIDGANPRMLADGIHWAGDLVVDPAAGKLYVASLGDGKIIEIQADGSGKRDFLTDIAPPRQMLVDATHRQLYWTSNSMPRIDRINLDGTGRAAVLTKMPGVAFGFALDPEEKTIYWTFPAGALYRSRLADGRHERLLQGLTNPDGLAIDLDNRKLYWAENGKISQANLDGTNVELLVKGKTTQYSSLEIFPPAD